MTANSNGVPAIPDDFWPGDLRKGVSEAQLREAFLSSGHPDNPNIQRVNDIRLKEKKREGVINRLTGAKKKAKKKRRKEKESPTFDFANSDVITHWLAENDLFYRYNTRKECDEVCATDGGAGEDWTEAHQAYAREHIEKTYRLDKIKYTVPLTFADTKWRNAKKSLAHTNKYDPFLAWLDSLPRWEDLPEEKRVPRARKLLSDMLGAEDTPFNEFASVYAFGAVYERAKNPGAKFDAIMLLMGPKGCGKSSFYELSLPEEYRADWFTDSLRWDMTVKEQVETILGAVFVEAAENVGLSRAEAAKMKSFQSSRHTKTRLSYKENAGVFKRMCMLIATTNEMDGVPFDPTGSRRHIPVVCKREVSYEEMKKFWDDHRDVIWAEIIHMWEQGFQFALVGDMEEEASRLAMEHMSENEIMADAVAELSHSAYRKDGAKLEFLIGEMGKLPNNGMLTTTEVKGWAATLKKAGWRKKQKRIPGTSCKPWRWFPPA